jgi:hypothetical protein
MLVGIVHWWPAPVSAGGLISRFFPGVKIKKRKEKKKKKKKRLEIWCNDF